MTLSNTPTASGLVDVAVLAEFKRSVGDRAFGELLETYFEEMRARLESLPTELAARRYDTVERLAHDMKSCSAALGGFALRDCAAVLERAGREADEATACARVAEISRIGPETLAAVEALRHTLE